MVVEGRKLFSSISLIRVLIQLNFRLVILRVGLIIDHIKAVLIFQYYFVRIGLLPVLFCLTNRFNCFTFNRILGQYSITSMARTRFEPRKYVRANECLS